MNRTVTLHVVNADALTTQADRLQTALNEVGRQKAEEFVSAIEDVLRIAEETASMPGVTYGMADEARKIGYRLREVAAVGRALIGRVQ